MSTAATMSRSVSVLVVSPQSDVRRELMSRVRSERWHLVEAVSGAHALDQLETGEFELLLLDPRLPDLDVAEFQFLVRAQFPDVQIMMLDGHTGLPLLPSSASEVLDSQMSNFLRTAAEERPTPVRLSAPLPDDVASSLRFPGMIGDSLAMQRVYQMAHLVAGRETTVLITGQSGTGKDLMAQGIHELSPRRANPFVIVNCAAIPEALLEAELFGYTKGAFTGAVQSRIGRIHAAQGGTLFLDEIGELPLSLQSKLLRFLEQGEVQRLGSSDNFRVDVRVIAATNHDVRKLVQERNFREDLYYRLAVFPIELPPLKERMEDLPALTASFLNQFCPYRMLLSPDASLMLLQHNWPGNVRELRNVIERATILAGNERQILAKHITI